MKTTNDNLLNVMYSNHRIVIDELIEYDYNGDMALTKKMCTVIRYNGDDATPMIADMRDMAQAWIACGCPSDSDTIGGVPSKWTKENLHAWIAG